MHLSILAILFASIPAALLAQQSGPRAPHPRTIPLERFRADASSFTSYSGIDDSLRLVIRDEQAWREIWRAIHRRVARVPPLPSIDFQQEMVVVAALGTRRSGGFGIRVDSATDLGDSVEIVVRKDVPGKRCLLSSALTQPVDLVRLPARPLPVRFRDRSVVEHCD